MKRLMVGALVVLSAVAQASVATGQTSPTDPNQQGMPWFTRPQGMPGMPWFFRPAAASPIQCWIAYWYGRSSGTRISGGKPSRGRPMCPSMSAPDGGELPERRTPLGTSSGGATVRPSST
jgi:hypothetical protein